MILTRAIRKTLYSWKSRFSYCLFVDPFLYEISPFPISLLNYRISLSPAEEESYSPVDGHGMAFRAEAM